MNNRRVKIYFNNGLTIEGEVSEWSDSKIILIDQRNQDTYTVLQIDQILCYCERNGRSLPEVKKEISQQLENTKPVDVVNLAELRKEANTLEREEFLKRMKSQERQDRKEEQPYQNPSSTLFTMSSVVNQDLLEVEREINDTMSPQHTTEKITNNTRRINQVLRKMPKR